MKKRNQASPRNVRTTEKAPQQKRMTRARQPRRTFVSLSQPRVHTGVLVWDIGEYEKARDEGRFITVKLTEMQRLQLNVADNPGLKLKDFLLRATHSQLTALRGTTPLCCTDFFEEKRSSGPVQPPKILALRGPLPGGSDSYVGLHQMQCQLAAELKRRGIA